jgi:predicted dehydrogenase
MEQVHTGLIGCGRHATWVIHPAARMIPQFDLVACCDTREGSATQAAQRLGISETYTDYLKMIDGERLDAVLVATTPENHAQIALDCLQRGLHVFVEKPPAKSVEEAERVWALSQEVGRSVMVGFMLRFRPFNYWVRKIIDQLAEPPILFQLSVGLGPAHSKVEGYPPSLYHLLSVGIHYVDLIRFFMGEVKSINAHLERYNDEQIAYAINMRCEHGLCLFNLNSCERLAFTTEEVLAGNVNERYQLIAKGTSIYLDNCHRLYWLKSDGTVEYYQPSYLAVSFLEGQSYYLGGYYQELVEFANSLLEGREPAVTIYDGLQAMRLVFDIYESAQRGETICA